MINMEGKQIILELSEHDASQLLALIEKEISQADKTSRAHWERQRQNILQSIDRASFSAFQRSLSFQDMFGE